MIKSASQSSLPLQRIGMPPSSQAQAEGQAPLMEPLRKSGPGLGRCGVEAGITKPTRLWRWALETDLVERPLEGCGRKLVHPPPVHHGQQDADPIDKRFCAPKETPPAAPAPEGHFDMHTVYDDTDRHIQPTMPSDLGFESRFESGNLWKAVRVGEYEYNLLLRPDIGTGVTLWFYFIVKNMEKNVPYTFNIINLYKEKSLFNSGFRPLLWSEKEYDRCGKGWTRTGELISYSENTTRRKNGSNFHTLSFTTAFEHPNDVAFLSMCFPYTYTDLQDYLECIERDEETSATFSRSELCRTVAGNRCDLLEITAPPSAGNLPADRRVIVVSGRVHPGESNASWVMHGLINFLTGESHVASLLRSTFVFMVVPMLNPDGVINGFYRNNLSGDDLNRQWRQPSEELHPTVYNLKERMRLVESRLALFIDVHGHSAKRNVFLYGCTISDGRERMVPKLLSGRNQHVSFRDCKFDIERSKENTGRVVVFREFCLHHSYTLEASFCGSSDPPAPPPDEAASRDGQMPPPPPMGLHYTTLDLKGVGKDLALTIADYAAMTENGWGCSTDKYRMSLALAIGKDAPGPGVSVLDQYVMSLKTMIQKRAEDPKPGRETLLRGAQRPMTRPVARENVGKIASSAQRQQDSPEEESGSDDDSGSDSGSERNERRGSSGEEINEPGAGSNQVATRKGGNEDSVQSKGSKGEMTAKEDYSATASHPPSPSAGSKVFPTLQRGSKSFSSFSASHAKSSAVLSVSKVRLSPRTAKRVVSQIASAGEDKASPTRQNVGKTLKSEVIGSPLQQMDLAPRLAAAGKSPASASASASAAAAAAASASGGGGSLSNRKGVASAGGASPIVGVNLHGQGNVPPSSPLFVGSRRKPSPVLRPKTGSTSLGGDGGPTNIAAALKSKLGIGGSAAQSQPGNRLLRSSSAGAAAMEAAESEGGGARMSLANRMKTATAPSPSASPSSSFGWSLKSRQPPQDGSASQTLGSRRGGLTASPDKRAVKDPRVGAAVLAQFRSDLQKAQEALMHQPADATKQATVATIAPDAAGLGPQIDAKPVRTRISAPTPPALQKPARSRLCLDPSQPGIGAGADTRGVERSYKDLVSRPIGIAYADVVARARLAVEEQSHPEGSWRARAAAAASTSPTR